MTENTEDLRIPYPMSEGNQFTLVKMGTHISRTEAEYGYESIEYEICCQKRENFLEELRLTSGTLKTLSFK